MFNLTMPTITLPTIDFSIIQLPTFELPNIAVDLSWCNPMNLLPNGMFVVTPELVTAVYAELLSVIGLAVQIFYFGHPILVALFAFLCAWNLIVVGLEFVNGTRWFAYA